MHIAKKERLASLDILRGFDLFLLVFFSPCFWLSPVIGATVPLFPFFSISLIMLTGLASRRGIW